jgi:hypothetical protein
MREIVSGPSPKIVFFLARAFPCGLLSHHFKDRASRIQSECSLSGFVEALPIFEALPQGSLSFPVSVR